MRHTPLILGLSFAVVTAGCRSAEPEPVGAQARIIDHAEQLLWGPAAMGAIGDVRIENRHVVAIVTRAKRAVGFAASGGNLVDLAWLPDGEDHLNQLTLYLDDEFPRQAHYHDLVVIEAGGPRTPAVVRARGTDTKNPKISIETDYILEPDATWLTLETRFTSSATTTISTYEPGDAIQWGRSAHMGPGVGYELPGRRIDLPWVAGIGRGTSYAWLLDEPKTTNVLSGSVWSDPVAAPVDLESGKTKKFLRHFAVGRGDTASLQPAIQKIHGTKMGTIQGRVTHGGQPIADAQIQVHDHQDKLHGIARADDHGDYAIDVPVGRYSVNVRAPGRQARAPAQGAEPFEVAHRATVARSFELGARSAIRWRIHGDGEMAEAVKVSVIPDDDQSKVNFGPTFSANGARNVVLSARGMGSAPVGVGRYRVIVSRGPEYELIQAKLHVTEGQRPLVEGRLERVVDTRGFIGADLHQHAAPSFDSGVSMKDRALSNAAEGVEVLVGTEHNVTVDYRPVIAALGLGRSVTSIVGTEATTHSVGHFNAFPLRIDHADARGGMVDPEGWAPGKIFDFVRGRGQSGIRTFIQSNHPRAGSIGYFDLMKFDPESGRAKDPRFSLEFDALEVVHFGFAHETTESLADWVALLANGVRKTATGNSDSHTIYGREVGWPRTYVCVDDDTPYRLDMKAFITALRRGCATISAGPFVVITAKDGRMGDTVPAPRGKVRVHVKVQAPSWISTHRLQIMVNGRPARTIELAGDGVVRFDADVDLKCKSDCFVFARVDGDKTMAPVVTQWRRRKPFPVALTNAIFFDVDGDGAYLQSKLQ